ncbi:hypothetical protein [endosymbiont GvMRE of Glomus versiforme]|uniref:hypothetical protein n=1 Tax=endosymbiont GvMRE of Glomus versiforme TaxID=2039283 RepID=UPI000EEBD25D|nr:hypothetical protein [endosymbiont GvMRE of Glomus versiforme]RHZ36428.1 hypothetical protein GvMRE_Ic1g93 [endosymbiont GvMRE of Glomus versiforme]
MQFTFTFSIKVTCINCQQTITQQDLTQSNFLIILPSFIIQHQACPLVKTNPKSPYPKCGFNRVHNLFYQKPNNHESTH